MITLLTAVIDGYDTLTPHRQADVDAYCITDDPDLHVDGWMMIVEPLVGHPNLAGKPPKCCPWRYTDSEWTIWVDASFRILSPTFAADMIQFGPVGQFPHPVRDCIYKEADYSTTLPKYAGLPLAEQADHYRTLSHPEGWGLWAGGIIVRQRTPAVEQFGTDWLAEIERWGYQDQVSEAPMLRKHGLYPNPIPGGLTTNVWLQYAGSARH